MNTSERAMRWIDVLRLRPHPEGGRYRETWRARRRVRDAESGSERSAGTAILYLLCEGERSRLHRIRGDEVWFHHDGGPLVIHVFPPEGGYRARRLAGRPDVDTSPQVTVEAGCWFGAEPEVGAGFALVACVVAPGFEFADLEWARQDALVERFPDQAETIRRLT